MSWRFSEEPDQDGLLVASWDTPILGVDRDSPNTKLRPGYIPYTQNMRLQSGRPITMYGYSLLDTGMDSDDNDSPLGANQYISGSTEQYFEIEADGTASYWNAAGNAWVDVFRGLASGHYNAINYNGYLIWANRGANWKWDGSNFLPLGATIISDCESDQDSLWSGETAETSVVKEGSQSYKATLTTGANTTLTYTPASNIDLTAYNLKSALAFTEANASIGFFIRIDDASEFDEAASYIEIATSSGVHEIQMPASAWINHATGTTVTFADNTWYRIELPFDHASFTETGTFDLSDVDTIKFYLENDGASTCNVYIDCIYIIYQQDAFQMPGVDSFAVWNDVLIGTGVSVAAPWTSFNNSGLYFTPVDAPDYFAATAEKLINPDAGGDALAVKRFFNQVFIGKEKSIHSLGGTTAGTTYPNFNFEITDVTDEHGVDGHRSIVEADRKLWFPWRGKYYFYDGTGTTPIEEPVSTDLADEDETLRRQKSAIYHTEYEEIWYSYPGDGDTENTRFGILMPTGDNPAFLGIQDGSTALNLNHLFIAEESGVTKIVGVDDAGDFMWIDDPSATDLDGTTDTFIVRFPWIGSDQWKAWHDLRVGFNTQSAGSITVQARLAQHAREMDAASFSSVGTLALSAAGNYGRCFLGGIMARWIQIQFTTSNATLIPFDLEWPLEVRFTPGGRT